MTERHRDGTTRRRPKRRYERKRQTTWRVEALELRQLLSTVLEAPVADTELIPDPTFATALVLDAAEVLPPRQAPKEFRKPPLASTSIVTAQQTEPSDSNTLAQPEEVGSGALPSESEGLLVNELDGQGTTPLAFPDGEAIFATLLHFGLKADSLGEPPALGDAISMVISDAPASAVLSGGSDDGAAAESNDASGALIALSDGIEPAQSTETVTTATEEPLRLEMSAVDWLLGGPPLGVGIPPELLDTQALQAEEATGPLLPQAIAVALRHIEARALAGFVPSPESDGDVQVSAVASPSDSDLEPPIWCGICTVPTQPLPAFEPTASGVDRGSRWQSAESPHVVVQTDPLYTATDLSARTTGTGAWLASSQSSKTLSWDTSTSGSSGGSLGSIDIHTTPGLTNLLESDLFDGPNGRSSTTDGAMTAISPTPQGPVSIDEGDDAEAIDIIAAVTTPIQPIPQTEDGSTAGLMGQAEDLLLDDYRMIVQGASGMACAFELATLGNERTVLGWQEHTAISAGPPLPPAREQNRFAQSRTGPLSAASATAARDDVFTQLGAEAATPWEWDISVGDLSAATTMAVILAAFYATQSRRAGSAFNQRRSSLADTSDRRSSSGGSLKRLAATLLNEKARSALSDNQAYGRTEA